VASFSNWPGTLSSCEGATGGETLTATLPGEYRPTLSSPGALGFQALIELGNHWQLFARDAK